MFYYVLFFILDMTLVVHSNEYFNNNYSVQMDLTQQSYSGQGYVILKDFKVYINKYFNITLMNHIATGATCSVKSKHYDTNLIVDGSNSIFKVVPMATADMTGQWVCDITREDIAALKLKFYIRAIGGPKKVKIKIADGEIDTKPSESSDLEYDEIGEYFYEDGETIQLVCYNTDDDHGDVYLRHYDSQGNISIETNKMEKLAFFQILMKAKDNNHVIDCIYETKNDELQFPYRVIFRLVKKSSNDDITITVNEIKLRPHITKSVSGEETTNFNFTFFQNEILTVTCETSSMSYGWIKIEDVKKIVEPKSYKEIGRTQWKTTVQFHTKSISKERFTLQVTSHLPSKPKVDIFLRKSEFPELLILGLTTKNVIDQYTHDSKTWIIDYRYSMGEILNLTCVAREKGLLQWMFGDTFKEEKNKENISNSFTLSEEHNASLIICERYNAKDNRQAIIKLHRYSHSNVVKDSDNTILIVWTIVAFMIAVTAIGLFFYCRRYWRAKNTQSTTDIFVNNHEDLGVGYSTSIDKTSDNNYRSQQYMVQNSLYDPKTYDSDTAEYQYIDDNDVLKKENNGTIHRMSQQVDNINDLSFHKNQGIKCNKTKTEATFDPRYANIASGDCSHSPGNTETYDYAYSMRYLNSKKREI